MTLKVSWPQALAWRMERQLLNPVGDLSVADTVRRLCGVQAQVASSAELAVRVRRTASTAGEVSRRAGQRRPDQDLGDARHPPPAHAGGRRHLPSLLAAGRSWEAPSWQKYFGVGPKEIEALRAAAREALDGRALTREELAAAVDQEAGPGPHRHRSSLPAGERCSSRWPGRATSRWDRARATA